MILDLKYIAKNLLVLSLTRELCSTIGFVFATVAYHSGRLRKHTFYFRCQGVVASTLRRIVFLFQRLLVVVVTMINGSHIVSCRVIERRNNHLAILLDQS